MLCIRIHITPMSLLDDTESDDSRSRSPFSDQEKTKKRIKYNQKYKKEWESEELFKDWLQPAKYPLYAYCKICNKNINVKSGKMQLYRHMDSKLHCRLKKSLKQQTLLSMTFAKSYASAEEFKKKADLYLAAYIAEHNLSIRSVEHLPDLIKIICQGFDSAQNIQCKCTKCTSVIKNVLGKYQLQCLVNILKDNRFSLIADESTDKGCTKHLGLIARWRKDMRFIPCNHAHNKY